MSCCNPNYRKIVAEKEERVNQKGKDSLPLLAKILLITITVGGLTIAFFT